MNGEMVREKKEEGMEGWAPCLISRTEEKDTICAKIGRRGEICLETDVKFECGVRRKDSWL